MENSLLAVFDEIPCTIAHGLWPNFGVTLKIHKNPIVIEISSKLIYNIETCICIRENYKNSFDKTPCHGH